MAPTIHWRTSGSTMSRSRVGVIVARTGATLLVALAGLLPVAASPAGALNGPRSVMLSETRNHRTVVVAPGARITVTLHSTYWSLTVPSSTPILAQIGTTTVVALAPGAAKGCVPGQGCGTLTARFVARHAGAVQLRATRTTCGEAMRCTPAQSVWTVLIRVR